MNTSATFASYLWSGEVRPIAARLGTKLAAETDGTQEAEAVCFPLPQNVWTCCTGQYLDT